MLIKENETLNNTMIAPLKSILKQYNIFLGPLKAYRGHIL